MIQETEGVDSYTTTGTASTFPAAHWRGLMVVVLLLGLAWINLSRAPEGARGETVTAPKTGFLAPDFTLATTDGDAIQLSALQGRPVVVNFWATWCPPCRAEMPELEALWQRFGQGSVMVLGVDQGESAVVVERFAREEVPTSFPLLLDESQEVGRLYQVHALPTTFFIDAQGRIQDVKVGGPLDMATLLAGVGKAMGGG
jgi:peroxiredoxin